jgi:predicted metal-dependent phosphoesterase TrpH
MNPLDPINPITEKVLELTGVFHIHTAYSFDANVSPRRMTRQLSKLGFDFAAITDHETIRGAVEAQRVAPEGLTIIIGAEYCTEKGDIVGLFLSKEVESRKSEDVISEIKGQGGIVVLPHPFKSHNLDEELIRAVDLIEVHNSRTDALRNSKALALAEEYGKHGIAGSDAHFLGELELARMTFNSEEDLRTAILHGHGKIVTAELGSLGYQTLTGLINLCKTRNPRLFLRWIRRLSELRQDIQ